jgi:hypothetical protein
MGWYEIVEFLELVLASVSTWAGMNTYKIVEMFKNYRPNIPVEYHSDELAEPSEEVWMKAKMEKSDRLEFRATMKAKKYVESKKCIETWHLKMARVRLE